MIEWIRQWLISLTCASLLLALADSLCPAGSVRQVGRLVGGLVLLVVMLRPFCTWDDSIMAMALVQQAGWDSWNTAQMEEAAQVNQTWMQTVIGEETAAYILDKATELDIDCQQVTVTCAIGEEGLPYPTAVTITGTFDQSQQASLTRVIQADLAIGEAQQVYQNLEEEADS